MAITTDVDMLAPNSQWNEKKFQYSLGNCERDPRFVRSMCSPWPSWSQTCLPGYDNSEGTTSRANVGKKNLKLEACSLVSLLSFPFFLGIDFHFGRKKILREGWSSAKAALPWTGRKAPKWLSTGSVITVHACPAFCVLKNMDFESVKSWLCCLLTVDLEQVASPQSLRLLICKMGTIAEATVKIYLSGDVMYNMTTKHCSVYSWVLLREEILKVFIARKKPFPPPFVCVSTWCDEYLNLC